MSAKVKAAPSKKQDTKVEKKGAPKAAKAAVTAAPAKAAEGAPAEPGIDPDEAEEQADADAARSSSSGGAEAALAAAAGTGEMSASFKNFRHHPDMENFYRFIYENDLRHEAAQIIDQIMVEKQNRKQLKVTKTQAH